MAVKVDEDGQIKAAFPIIELHNFIFRAERRTLSELIANNGINAGIILPEMNWQNSTTYLYKNAQLTLFINFSATETLIAHAVILFSTP